MLLVTLVLMITTQALPHYISNKKISFSGLLHLDSISGKNDFCDAKISSSLQPLQARSQLRLEHIQHIIQFTSHCLNDITIVIPNHKAPSCIFQIFLEGSITIYFYKITARFLPLFNHLDSQSVISLKFL
jgi:hypothetical protein